jgi:DNA-binding response OmpR family regulator
MHATPNQPVARFNVLLTEDRQHAPGHWTRQLPTLLEPQGVKAYIARTGREAVDMVNDLDIHAALIDLGTPQDDSTEAGSSPVGHPGAGGLSGGGGEAQGLWILEVLKRQPNRPPIVMVNSRAIARIQAQRFLNEALRLGAFSVVNRPSDLEDMLAVIRRLIDRQYEGTWPNN